MGKSPWHYTFGENVSLNDIRLILEQDKLFEIPSNLNEDLKNLLQQLLAINPNDRLTAKQCLQSQFLQPTALDEVIFLNHELYSNEANSHYYTNTAGTILTQFLNGSLVSPIVESDGPKYRQLNQHAAIQDIDHVLSMYSRHISLAEFVQKHDTGTDSCRDQSENPVSDRDKYQKFQEQISYKSEKCSLTAQSIEQLYQQCLKNNKSEFSKSITNKELNTQKSMKSSNNGLEKSNFSTQLRNLEEKLWEDLGLGESLVSEACID